MNASQSPIFITYRREDSAGHAGRLADDLKDVFGDDEVFIDVAALSPGQDVVQAITDAVAQSAAVLVVIGPRWASIADGEGRRRLDVTDDYVRLEVTEALAQQKPLVPLLVHDARMPALKELPAELARLARYNALELTDLRWPYDVGRLVDALELFGVSPQQLGPDGAFPEEGKRGRAEQRDAWFASYDLRSVRDRVDSFVQSRGWEPGSWGANVIELRGGSKRGARLWGGFFVRQETLPTAAKIRLTERGVKTLVEALIWEEFGPGVFAGMEGRYESAFDKWMRDLHRVTSANER